MKHEETYTSRLHTHVHFEVYEPKVVLRIKGVIFILHDMGEDLRSYDHFANYLLNHGFAVIVSDIAGHGQSLIDFEQGYFGEGDVLEGLIEDIRHLQEIIMPRFSDSLYFFMGAGLGASLVREYASKYGDYFQGMILLSPSYHLVFERFGSLRLKLQACLKGNRYHPMERMKHVYKKFSRKLGNDELEWMTNNEKERHRFKEDTMQNFAYTLKGYQDILKIDRHANSLETMVNTPEYLPLLIVAGNQDPITRHGKDAKRIYHDYKNIGLEDVTLNVYEGRRHALLKDKNNDEIYKDILTWLNARSFY